MTAHTELTSQEDFQKALQTKDKYVFIYAYEGQITQQAEEYAKKFSDKVDSYKFDATKIPQAAKYHGVTQTPTAILYMNGEQVKKVEGMNPEGMKEIGQLITSS